ncbi:MAG TPA: hypothetical protein VK452_03880 [Dissulfurispiraceae bacterium]|nr:hypothetical protein [Dissulfurispiraceae bacterium]
MIALIALYSAAFAAISYGQQRDEITDLNLLYRDQQKQLNDQLIDYAAQQIGILKSMKDFTGREQYDSALDYLPDAAQFQQARRYSGDDEYNYFRAKLDSLKLRTIDAERKKNDLKARVVNYNGQLPGWWDKAETEFAEKRKIAVQAVLKR